MKRDRAAGLLVAGLAAVLFLPALQGAFLNWDDDVYVTANPHLRQPWLPFLAWALSHCHQGWQPLTLLSWKLDHSFWGLNPWGYHLTQILLHAANAAAVFLLLKRLLGDTLGAAPRGAAFLGALLFAVHPAVVESVAWVSERKGLLAAHLSLLATLLLLRWVSTGGRGAYGLALLVFLAALLAKPTALPFPLLILALGRFRRTPLSWLRLLRACLPFILFAVGGALLTVRAQAAAGALEATTQLPFSLRLWTGLRAVPFYLWGTFTGRAASPHHPIGLPPFHLSFGLDVVLAAALLVGLTALALGLRRRTPLPALAWFWFLLWLLPVVGPVFVGNRAAADRYLYLALPGPALLLAGGLATLAQSHPRCFRLAGLLALVAAFLLGQATRHRLGVWRTSRALWEEVLRHAPASPLAHYNLGNALLAEGRLEEAARHWRTAVALDPGHSRAWNQLGNVALLRGDPAAARRCYLRALAADPQNAVARENLRRLTRPPHGGRRPR